MNTKEHHDAEGPEEAQENLPPVVPSGRASGRAAASLRQAGVSNGPAAEDAGGLAKAESGLHHRVAIRPERRANTTAGAATFSSSIEPTTLGVRERPVRHARRRFHWGYEHTNPACRERPDPPVSS